MNEKKMKPFTGMLIVLGCGILWALSGVMGQALFRSSEVTAAMLTVLRMLIAGSCIVGYGLIRDRKALFAVWKEPKTVVQLFIFAIGGIMCMQYTYFAAIAESNAATATVLQYTYPVLILLYTAFAQRHMPKGYEIIAIFLAFAGVVLISTHGKLQALSISGKALVLGLISAVAFVFYTVYPKKLYEQYSVANIVGWSFLIGGVTLLILTRSYDLVCVDWNWQSVGLVLGVAFFGTLIPFVVYGIGVQVLGEVRASLFVTVEPVVSAILAAVLLSVQFQAMDIVGFVCIIGAIEYAAVRSIRG